MALSSFDVNRHLFDFTPWNKDFKTKFRRKGLCFSTIKVLTYLSMYNLVKIVNLNMNVFLFVNLMCINISFNLNFLCQVKFEFPEDLKQHMSSPVNGSSPWDFFYSLQNAIFPQILIWSFLYGYFVCHIHDRQNIRKSAI